MYLNRQRSETKPLDYAKELKPKRNGKSLTYGPFKNIPKYSYKELKIHFLNVGPDVVDKVFERRVDIGYGTGFAHYKDFHELYNQGPE